MPRVLTALPVYNEAAHVTAVLDQVRTVCPDVLVVDDGSIDGTSALVAARGHGSWLGGRRLDVRSRTERPAPTLSTALVATGFGYDPERRRRQGRRAAWLLPRVRDIRRFGAAAVELCHVAAGRVDAYVEDGLGAWDIAAGSLVATEAGAAATDFAGGPVRPAEVLVAHPDIHTGIIELLHSCPGDEEWPG